ncbi:mitochondrial inner membrane protease ATP23 [Trypanosoma theileri]|uniref:Mitochondrial inner membrane protease ATP23 n=1 Tax=Trypanosoma theileri TaxID=67003 RepID=A0A1X0P8Q9_9TRYP|nr:mitochondrial inner membrane protease ATP23 [Trypanosoma theileri]ORC93013.1 mitochondrial inner membrane protease ATP23 [Trypanosoma theileri]
MTTLDKQKEEKGEADDENSRVHRECEAAVDEVLASVNTVQYLIKSIEEITQSPFLRERIKCVSLRPNKNSVNKNSNNTNINNMNNESSAFSNECVSAGYMWQRAREDCEKGDILLIEENMVAGAGRTSSTSTTTTSATQSQQPSKFTLDTVERNLRHELIHAFDDARGVIEPADCTHQACSEIRAARLSGDCFVGQELRRGRLDPLHSGMLCVRRRAAMALETNPVCRGFSDRAVERVFRRCYSDYEPFAAPIYAMGSYGDEKFDVRL